MRSFSIESDLEPLSTLMSRQTLSRAQALSIDRDKHNYDWETGDWINKGFIYDFENEWSVKTSRKRKNK